MPGPLSILGGNPSRQFNVLGRKGEVNNQAECECVYADRILETISGGVGRGATSVSTVADHLDRVGSRRQVVLSMDRAFGGNLMAISRGRR